MTDSAGAPLQGINVYVYRGGSVYGYANTAADGSYRIAGLTAGSYTAQFQDPVGTYAGEWFDDAAAWTSAALIDVAAGEAVAGVDVSLARAASISGVVTDAAGVPLQGVYVYSAPGNGYAYTAADGSYRIGGLSAGSYQIRFNGSGTYLGEWFDDAAAQTSAAVIDVAAGEAVVGVDASLAKAGSICGVVTDAAGAPLQGIYVYAYQNGSGFGVSTAADGSYPNRRVDGGELHHSVPGFVGLVSG